MKLEIEGVNSLGQGLSHLPDGRVVFCTGALPGETVVARLTMEKKAYAVAEIETVAVPHPQRVKPSCRWYETCGGCQLQHASRSLQLELKSLIVEDSLRRLGGFDLPEKISCLPSPVQWGYRNKASFPVRRTASGETTGFFKMGTHDIVPIETCPLVCDQAAQLYGTLRGLVQDGGFSAYDEKTGRGWLRHIVVRASTYGSGLLALLVVTSKPDQEGMASLRDLWRYLQSRQPALSGLALSINPSRGNRIIGDETVPVAGTDRVHECLGPFRLEYDGTSFFQVNTAQAARLFDYASSLVPDGSRTLELYCGVGSLTAFLARKSRAVTAAEIWPPAVEMARKNMSGNNLTNVELRLSPAEKLPSDPFEGQDCLVVDPPRTGCDGEMLARLAGTSIKSIVYVSCNPATLARDAARLQSAGYQLVTSSVRAFDMFPQTSHVETVALLSKLNTEHHLDIEIGEDELSEIDFSKDATYGEIKKYVLDKYGLKVSSLYIAQIKGNMV